MQRARLPLSIRAIHPDAVYQGKVFTQLVEVSVQSNIFLILDAQLLISDEHRGRELELELTTFSVDPNIKQATAERGMEVSQGLEAVRFFGEVVEVDEKTQNFLLDVGPGTIRCGGADRVEEGDTHVKAGDFVIHDALRVDLRGVHA